MRFCGLFSLLLAFVLLFSLCLVIQANAESAWTIQTVGIAANGSTISIALDSNDIPHIAYIEYTNGEYRSLSTNVTYASWNGSGWDIQTLDSGITGSLALDSFDNPHICYIDSTPASNLKYASWTGTNWDNQTVDSSFLGSFQLDTNSLELDSNNDPHVSYSKGNNLMYASLTGSNWSIETVDSNSSIFFHHSSVSLDANNYPHMIYGDAVQVDGGTYVTLANVKYAEWNGSSWSIQTVFPNVTSFGNIALDSKGYPHFTYIIGSSLSYAGWDGSTWKSQIVDSNPTISSYPTGSCFLALDRQNNSHISYWRDPYQINSGSDSGLMHAYWTGSTWKIETVDNNGTSFGAGPIVSDSIGNLHIGYSSVHPGQAVYYYVDIKYATRTESTSAAQPSVTELIILTVVLIIALLALLAALKYGRRRARKTSQSVKGTGA